MNKKIFFRVVGGIGNQLFIYFTGKALEKQGYEVVFDLKSGFFWDAYGRKPILQKLDLVIKKTSWFEVSIFYIVKYITSPIIGFFLKEKTPHTYTDLSGFNHKLNFIEGYFQSYVYFDRHKKSIIKHLDFDIIDEKEMLNYLELIKKNQSVCVHIRTIQKSEKTTIEEKNELLDVNYYNEAIDDLKTKIGKNVVFFVFARDINWAKQNLNKGFNYIFIEPSIRNDLQEFILMTQCKYFILANSTFSWWAAYISGSQQVIYKNHANMKIGITDNYFPSKWNEFQSK